MTARSEPIIGNRAVLVMPSTMNGAPDQMDVYKFEIGAPMQSTVTVEWWRQRGERKSHNDWMHRIIRAGEYCIVINGQRTKIVWDSRSEIPCPTLRAPMPKWLINATGIETPVELRNT
jgi:hypothetical protein